MMDKNHSMMKNELPLICNGIITSARMRECIYARTRISEGMDSPSHPIDLMLLRDVVLRRADCPLFRGILV